MNDDIVAALIDGEAKRQREGLELIPSENYVSHSVRQALGSVFTNKYSEGYPGHRYYGGQEFTDKVSSLLLTALSDYFAPTTPTYSRIAARQQTRRCIAHGAARAIRFWRWT